jgi:hypothetical protein
MSWWSRSKRHNDLERELSAHLELEAAEQRDGRNASEEEARYAARRALGNLTKVIEDTEPFGRAGG